MEELISMTESCPVADDTVVDRTMIMWEIWYSKAIHLPQSVVVT